MIRHCVFMNLRSDADPDELADVLAGLASVTDRLAGASGFVSGPNRDSERKSQDYPLGFTIDFVDAAALETYIQDAEHKTLGARLVAQCRGRTDGIVVFDISDD